MKHFIVALAVAVLSAAKADAQVVMMPTPPQTGSAFGSEPILRITIMLRTAVDLGPTASIPEATAQEAARRTIYAMAANECAALSESFQSECRLSSVQIIASAIPAAVARPANAMTATAIYELRPLRQTSGR